MLKWKQGDKYGQAVRTAARLEKRDFVRTPQRRPGVLGTVLAHSDSHGLCFEVQHIDGTTAWYDPDELTLLEPTPDQLKQLWKVCQGFIEKHNITCGETIYQVDSVSLDSLEFIEEICDVVGYSDGDEDP